MTAVHSVELWARAGATGLSDSVLVGTAIALLASFVVFLLRQKSAAARFGVLMTALVTTASLPFFRLAMRSDGIVAGQAPLLRIADSWAPWILGTWAAVAGLALARVGAGVLRLVCIRRDCRRLDPSLVGDIGQHCPSRKVELLISSDISVPSAIGFFRPAVVLPAWVMDEMSPEEVRHVVLHELSHLRRWDDWTNLLQQIVKALFFFHPAVWWLESRLSLEREMACDDAVLMRSGNPRGYAECLARIAERSFLRRGLSMAQAAVGRVRQTSRRVARILQFDKSKGARNARLPVACAMVFALAGIAAALWHTPLLLSFDGPAPGPIARASAPDVSAPSLPPIKAAWHERKQLATSKPRAQMIAPRAVAQRPSVAEIQPRLLRAALTTEDQAVNRTVLVVVVQDDSGIAVWRITTWQYSPEQQVRAAHKKT